MFFCRACSSSTKSSSSRRVCTEVAASERTGGSPWLEAVFSKHVDGAPEVKLARDFEENFGGDLLKRELFDVG